MLNNSRVLLEFVNGKIRQNDPELSTILGAIEQEALAVRFYALCMTLRVHILLFCRLQAHSWLFQLRQLSGRDGIESYERMKTLATQLFLRTANTNMERLIESL
jgi:hypothetical protein